MIATKSWETGEMLITEYTVNILQEQLSSKGLFYNMYNVVTIINKKMNCVLEHC
jgi:hypothetical protein